VQVSREEGRGRGRRRKSKAPLVLPLLLPLLFHAFLGMRSRPCLSVPPKIGHIGSPHELVGASAAGEVGTRERARRRHLLRSRCSLSSNRLKSSSRPLFNLSFIRSRLSASLRSSGIDTRRADRPRRRLRPHKRKPTNLVVPRVLAQGVVGVGGRHRCRELFLFLSLARQRLLASCVPPFGSRRKSGAESERGERERGERKRAALAGARSKRERRASKWRKQRESEVIFGKLQTRKKKREDQCKLSPSFGAPGASPWRGGARFRSAASYYVIAQCLWREHPVEIGAARALNGLRGKRRRRLRRWRRQAALLRLLLRPLLLLLRPLLLLRLLRSRSRCVSCRQQSKPIPAISWLGAAGPKSSSSLWALGASLPTAGPTGGSSW